MNGDTFPKIFLGILIGIFATGVLVLIFGRGTSGNAYVYRNLSTASTIPIQQDTSYQTGTYTLFRYVPPQKASAVETQTYTYYTYPETIDYNYYYQDTQTLYPNGCTATSLYSITTGFPCR